MAAIVGVRWLHHRRVRYGNVILKRGDLAPWEWFSTIASGDFQPRNIAIVLLDAKRRPVWIGRSAWSAKYAPTFAPRGTRS